MKPERDSVDDLMVLARRGDLSAADQLRLREALEDAPELRLMYEAGCAFDREAPVLADDDERIEAIARRVQKRLYGSPRGSPRRLRRVVQMALAGVLIAGVAVGAIEVVRAPRRPPLEPSPSVLVPLPTAARGGPVSTPAAPPPASETASPPVPAAPSLPPMVASPPRAGAAQAPPAASTDDGFDDALAQPEVPAPRAVSARDLFVAANDARVRGDVADALTLLQTLEDRFPASNEAKTALLTLGILHLQTGQAETALRDFRRFKATGSSATMPEALWGESQALRALGRTAEERAVLGDLLRDFPHSAYAGAANKRLVELP